MEPAAARLHALEALGSYWPRGGTPVLALGLPKIKPPTEEPLPPDVITVAVPEWAQDIAVDGALLIPAHCFVAGTGSNLERVDWLAAVFWYLNGCGERAFEAVHGPIHSYSSRLTGWDTRLWDHAWVNRIALLLRRMASREAEKPEEELFGPRPRAEILLTHDVDAIRKTWSIRVKQSTFHGFNAARNLARGQLRHFTRKLAAAARFAVHGGDLWYFDELAALVRGQGLTSHFFVYGHSRVGRSLRLRLFDPSYDVLEPRLADTLRRLRRDGFEVGLHQSFDSWQDAARMREEKARVERALGAPVTTCRQHWLRFGWAETWEAQDEAGLRLDTTLGFNERPGFRNGAALRFHPWSPSRGAALALECVPMILMDSQLHDYAEFDAAEREREIRRWVDEVRAVGGVASVIWHQHVIGPDYGWRPGIETLLRVLAEDPA